MVITLGLAAMSCPRDDYEAWIAPHSTAENLTVIFGDSPKRERPVHWENLVVFRFDAHDEQVWNLEDTSNGGRGTKRSRITLGQSAPATVASPRTLDLVPGCYWATGVWQANYLRFRIDSAGAVQTLPRGYSQRDEIQQPHRLMSCLIMTSPHRTP